MIRFSFKIARLILGVFLVIFGVAALIIPFFPFAWVGLIGLGLLGVRMAFWNKIRAWLQKQMPGQ